MNSIFPLESYTTIYYNFLLLMTLVVFFASFSSALDSSSNLKGKNVFGFFIFVLVLLYMGLRPISFRFGDMGIYNIQFKGFQMGIEPDYEKDVLFQYFQYNFSKIGSASMFFFTCAFLYIYPLYSFSKKVFKDYWFYSFFMLIISMSFWAYGTNGIRNGIATSLFLYGLSREKKLYVFLLLILSVFIHKSMLLPLLAYVVIYFYSNPKVYFYSWLMAIPLSLLIGGFFSTFFLNLGLVEEKSISNYLGEFNQASEAVVLKVGFRWDFLLYSATGVFAGWYFVFKRKFTDHFYNIILSLYLIVNAFWILVIRANYSNRFAYLSWFMLGAVIIYPLLKNKFFEHQHRVVGIIILFYFVLTYLLEVVFKQ